MAFFSTVSILMSWIAAADVRVAKDPAVALYN